MVQKDSFDGARPCKSKDALNPFNCQDRTASQWLLGCATNEHTAARLTQLYGGRQCRRLRVLQIQIWDSGDGTLERLVRCPTCVPLRVAVPRPRIESNRPC